MIFFILFVGIFIKNAQTMTDLSLIFQYFTKIHPVYHVILVSDTFDGFFDLLLNFSSVDIHVERIETSQNDLQPADIFHPTNFPIGVFVDSGISSKFLENSCNEKYFNASYFWLINGFDNKTANEALGNLFHIQINSQITFIEKIGGFGARLVDVYSYGRHLQYELVITEFAEWTGKELKITKQLPLMYRKEYRGDFKGIVMRQAIVIARRPKNHSIEHFDQRMTQPGTSQDILSLVKFHHNQGLVLKQRYNFRTRVNRIAKDITGAWIRGLRTGGLGILTRNESDVSSTGGIVTLCRLKEFDFIHTRFQLKVDWFYRVTPDLIVNGEKKITFLIPFDQQVWLCVIFGFALIGICLKLYPKGLKDNLITYESTIVHVFSIVASQGLALTYHHVFRRIITFIGQLLVIMVLNLYAGQLLNVILTPIKDPFESRDDVMNNDIHMARYTTWGIAIIVFKQLETSNRPDYNEKFFNTADDLNTKMLDKKTIAVFDDYYEGLQYMKNGPVAFTGESSNIQGLIKRTFTPDEICEVKKKMVIYTPQYFAMKKHSQYSRVFMIGLLKADESGILQKLKNTYFEEMPPCVAGVTLYSVPFTKIKGAMVLLTFAALLSTTIFIMEHLISRLQINFYVAKSVKEKIATKCKR